MSSHPLKLQVTELTPVITDKVEGNPQTDNSVLNLHKDSMHLNNLNDCLRKDQAREPAGSGRRNNGGKGETVTRLSGAH